MDEFIRPFIASMGDSFPVGTILHMGAGSGSLADTCLESGAKRVFLLEPLPDRQPQLERLAQDNKRISFLPKALHQTSGTAPFHIFNLSAYSSLHEPAGLSRLFPNLRIERSIDCATIGLAELLKKALPGSKTDKHVLILDIPGEELPILERLAETGQLARFAHLFLRQPALALYRDMPSGAAIPELLAAHLFDLVARDDADPDLPVCYYKRSPFMEEMRRQSAKISQLTEKTGKQATQIREKDQEISRIRDEHDELTEKARQQDALIEKQKEEISRIRNEHGELAEKARQQDALIEKQKEEISRIRDEHDELAEKARQQDALIEKQKEEISRIRDEHGELAEKARQQQEDIEKLKHELDKAAKDTATCRSELEKAKSELDGTLQELKRSKTRLEVLESENDSLHRELSALEEKCADEQKLQLERIQEQQKELEIARSDRIALQDNLALALRTQALREADLEDLRASYQELLDTKESQDALLQSLTARLEAAVAYLEMLRLPPAETADENGEFGIPAVGGKEAPADD